MMKQLLSGNLLSLAEAHAAQSKLSLATIGAKAGLRSDFFPNIWKGDLPNFSVGTYDFVVQWFSDNWPKGAIWPRNVARPKRGATHG